jgi:PIN domain nuclease of toxin-antitoxin system
MIWESTKILKSRFDERFEDILLDNHSELIESAASYYFIKNEESINEIPLEFNYFIRDLCTPHKYPIKIHNCLFVDTKKMNICTLKKA